MLMRVADMRMAVVALKPDTAELAARYFGGEAQEIEVEDLDAGSPALIVVGFTEDGRPIVEAVGVGAGGDAALRDTSDFSECWRAMG